jgi:hypothetical protein
MEVNVDNMKSPTISSLFKKYAKLILRFNESNLKSNISDEEEMTSFIRSSSFSSVLYVMFKRLANMNLNGVWKRINKNQRTAV